ncbi:MAG: SusC/RagA family TonB-linked outer membrane protein, partial [Rikenellaceae bacterium]
GVFELRAEAGSPITVQFIGYDNVNTTLASGMQVTLQEAAVNVEELVVVGFGTVKKESLTGSVATVSSAQFEDQGGLSNPVQALQGQVAGVMITRTSSAPGQESWDMQLRGVSSTNTADPMVVVDGVTYNSIDDLGMLSPDDIESMNFLKDGSAAIYGSRAANGVILIQTKKGKSGKTTVQYNGSVTVKTPGIEMDWCDIYQWADGLTQALEGANYTASAMYDMALQMQKYGGYWVNYNEQTRTLRSGMAGKQDMTYSTSNEYLDGLFDTAVSQEHTISVSGGTERSSYRLSLGYNYDDSTLVWGENSNQRYNLRLNNSFKLSDNITLDSSISYNRTELVYPTIQSKLTIGAQNQPGLPSWTDSGLPYAFETSTAASVAAYLELGGETTQSTRQLNINETLNAKITSFLDFNLNLGYNSRTQVTHAKYESVDFYNYQELYICTGPTTAQSYFQSTENTKDYYTGSGYFNFHEQFGAHSVGATIGGSYEYTEYDGFGIKMMETDSNIDVVNGTGDVTRQSVNYYETALASAFARFNYDYDSRYLLEANMRYDGSSKFAAGNRWNFFWGVSGGWRLNQEAFMENATWLDDLKIRGSYAVMGNQDGIGNYDGIQLYSMSISSGQVIGDNLLSYITTSGLASDSRTWERVQNWNVGVDFSFYGFTGSFDYWQKYNDNMLISITYPGTQGGVNAPDTNVGEFRAWGYEGALNYRRKIGEVNLSAGGTVSFARNEIIDNGTDVELWSEGYSSTREGYPLASLMGYEMYGRAQTYEEAQEYYETYKEGSTISFPAQANFNAGINLYKDQNGDGSITEEDLIYLGSGNPEISYSFNLAVEWKGLEISAVFQGSANRVMYVGEAYYAAPFRSVYFNTITDWIGNTWSLDNQDAWYNPLCSSYGTGAGLNTWNYGHASTHTALNGNYLRLKNLTVAYTIPAKKLENVKGLSGVRVYVTGTDIWEKTNMPFNLDPEASYSSYSGSNFYPFTRNWIVGLGLTF